MRKIVFVLAGVASAVAAPAVAQTATSDMTVQLTTEDSCTVSAGTLDFGTSANVGTAAVDGSAAITITCNPGANWSLTLDDGLNFATTRQMSDGTDVVPYDLYSDSARTTAFASDTGVGSGSSTVYGQIPASAAAVPAGSYTDTVVATVTY